MYGKDHNPHWWWVLAIRGCAPAGEALGGGDEQAEPTVDAPEALERFSLLCRGGVAGTIRDDGRKGTTVWLPGAEYDKRLQRALPPSGSKKRYKPRVIVYVEGMGFAGTGMVYTTCASDRQFGTPETHRKYSVEGPHGKVWLVAGLPGESHETVVDTFPRPVSLRRVAAALPDEGLLDIRNSRLLPISEEAFDALSRLGRGEDITPKGDPGAPSPSRSAGKRARDKAMEMAARAVERNREEDVPRTQPAVSGESAGKVDPRGSTSRQPSDDGSAEQTLEEAGWYLQGARGEEQVAAALSKVKRAVDAERKRVARLRSPSGNSWFYAFHDVQALPGDEARINVDHALLTPAGIFAIETKAPIGKTWVSTKEVASDSTGADPGDTPLETPVPHPLLKASPEDSYIACARQAAAKLREVLELEETPPAVLCISGGHVSGPSWIDAEEGPPGYLMGGGYRTSVGVFSPDSLREYLKDTLLPLAHRGGPVASLGSEYAEEYASHLQRRESRAAKDESGESTDGISGFEMRKVI